MKTFSSPQIKNTQTTQSEKLYIIAIGASAGGLEAINRIFDNTPKAGVAYVIVQHLSPDHESFMAELLEKHSTLAISVAETDMLLEPNQIYLLPKGKNMTVKNGRLVLTDSQDKQPNSAIDIFFDSLAEDQGDKSIAVILSGMGRDGTKGIEAIKKQGGFVIVQDPDTAQFDSMPNSAIHSGNVDAILAPELIPEEIIAYVKWEQLEINIGNRISKSNEDKLTKILNLIQLHTPLDFSGYKRPTIIRKIIIRMARNDIKSLEDYITFLDNNHNEIITLAQGFLISVTKFFRDKDAFEVIRKNLLPEIIKNKLQIDTLKVWVIGCATGEEAYSLAILIREELNTLHSGLMVKIFASDIDKPALLKASKGIYDRSIEDEVSEERLNKFFIKLGNTYKVKDEIRKMIVFANHDIIRQPPYGKMDLISCRNLLIYIEPLLQKRILNSLHFCLNMGGYLFLGPSESLGTLRKSFTAIDEKWKIYKSNQAAIILNNTTYSTPGLDRHPTYVTTKHTSQETLKKSKFTEIIHQLLLEESGYDAGVCVDNTMKIVHTFGNYSRFLLPKIFNFNLIEMLPTVLSTATSTTLRKALSQKKKTVLREITFQKDGLDHTADILVKPFFPESSPSEYILVVLFKETETKSASIVEGEVFHMENQTLQQIEDLKGELESVKQELKETYETLEESNTNLAYHNEEILSFNEEMQSSNEELQSVNEELQTVNQEYQLQIKELADLNDDLDNYFKASIHGQIYVDKNLVLKKFTPSAVKQINFNENDVGRLLSDISTNIKFVTLINDIKNVITSSHINEKEIQTQDGKWYQMVIMPYIKGGNKKNEGAIITFNDITLLKQIQGKLSRRNADHKTFIYNASHDLKIPVVNIKMLVYMLKEIIDSENQEAMDLMEMIEVSGRNLIDTIAELSDIARNEIEIYEYKNVDVKQLIEEVKVSMNELLSQSKANFILDLKEPLIPFSKKNLRSILFNLLNNAIKYRSPYRTPEIHISTEMIGEIIALTVKDNGLGIEPEHLNKIFERFERTYYHVEGSGIGLFLVKRMIENSGGSVEVESIFGKETTFKINFKVNREVE